MTSLILAELTNAGMGADGGGVNNYLGVVVGIRWGVSDGGIMGVQKPLWWGKNEVQRS